MSVRRLADEPVQPAGFAFNRENARWAEQRIALYPAGRQQSAVIPLLMRAQDQEGWVTRAAIEAIAEMLGMPYIRVLEVATFYTQFQLQPVGSRAHIQVCGTTPCMLRGAEDLRAVCQSKIHPEPHHTNADGTLSWEEVECLGACVNAPMIAIYQDTYEDLTAQRLEEIIDAFAEGRGDTIPPGPQNGRKGSAPLTGQTTLLEPPSRRREKFVPPPPPEAPAAPVAASPSAAPAAPAAAPAAAAKPEEKPAAPVQPEPTSKGRPRDVGEEVAPAIEGPNDDVKVSQEKAEAERKAFDRSAGATGKPARAMRPKATGAESKASKMDAGRAPGKAKRTGPGSGSVSAGATPDAEPMESTTGKADVDAKQLDKADAEVATSTAKKPVRKSRAKADKSKPTREVGGRTKGPEDVASVDGDDKKTE